MTPCVISSRGNPNQHLWDFPSAAMRATSFRGMKSIAYIHDCELNRTQCVLFNVIILTKTFLALKTFYQKV